MAREFVPRRLSALWKILKILKIESCGHTKMMGDNENVGLSSDYVRVWCGKMFHRVY